MLSFIIRKFIIIVSILHIAAASQNHWIEVYQDCSSRDFENLTNCYIDTWNNWFNSFNWPNLNASPISSYNSYESNISNINSNENEGLQY